MNLPLAANARGRRGVTLLELLVTIGIILAITAAVIPVMAPVMAGRRLREASRGVNTFISSARNKAMATGRSVGVAFERLEADPQASIVLSMVEVPPPWSGDTVDSGMLIGANGRLLGFYRRDLSVPSGYSLSGDIGWQIARVRPGDLIKLNNRNTAYRIYSGEVCQDLDADGSIEVGEYVDSNVDGAGLASLDNSYNNDPSATDPNLGHFVLDPSNSIWSIGYDDPRMALQPVRLAPGLYSFQIIRQPVKSSSGSLQLPVGTIVDLSVSGDDSFNRPRCAGIDVGTPVDKRPVTLLFAPNGSLERMWQPDLTDTTKRQFISFRPTAGIQFLVGRRDGVGIGPNNVTATPPDELPNWRDLENIWISVNAQTGLVLSNPNAQVQTNLDVRTSDEAIDDSNIDYTALQTGLSQARAFARQGQSMGGN
jgi:type II secretory pathway pseudopilin PulG